MTTFEPSEPPTAPGHGGLDPGAVRLLRPLAGISGWLKFLGVMNIIFGALSALSCYGIIIAWLPVWIGIVMFQAASRMRQGMDLGDPASAEAGTQSLALALKIQAITLLVVMCFYALLIILLIAGAVAMPLMSQGP